MYILFSEIILINGHFLCNANYYIFWYLIQIYNWWHLKRQLENFYEILFLTNYSYTYIKNIPLMRHIIQKCLWIVHHLWFRRNKACNIPCVWASKCIRLFPDTQFTWLYEKLTEINWQAIQVGKHFIKGHKLEIRWFQKNNHLSSLRQAFRVVLSSQNIMRVIYAILNLLVATSYFFLKSRWNCCE